jgi:hypothetical protein
VCHARGGSVGCRAALGEGLPYPVH